MTPARTLLSDTEIRILMHKLEMSVAPATAEEATYAVARLGGHLRRNGLPGWQTLAAASKHFSSWGRAGKQPWRRDVIDDLADATGKCVRATSAARRFARNAVDSAPARRVDWTRVMRTFARLARLVGFVALAAASFPAFARTAHADPWFGFGQNAAEDRFVDGDIDADDAAQLPSFGRARVGASDVRAKTWVSLLAFASQFPTGAHEVGLGVVVGIAFDRVAQGPSHVARDRAPPLATDAPPPSAPPPASAPPSIATPALDSALANGAVRAAWRTAGVEATDVRVDEMIARAHRSAALPEARLRALRVLNSGEDVTYVDASGHVYDTIGANLSLEARLTWRLDRLIYADDEPTIERVRLERQEARGRLGTHVLELLFGWQRALFDLATTPAGSRAEMEAVLRRWESEIALDVLTSGWFGAQAKVRSAGKEGVP